MGKFNKEILDLYIFDEFGKKTIKIKEIIVLYISSEVENNFEIHKQLFGKEVLYITYEDIYVGKYKCILNIGNKYKLYIKEKVNITSKRMEYISRCIANLLCDFVIVHKIKNIDKSITELDIALDLGNDIYAIPGNIFKYENYLANYSIKQGAIPICSKHDAKYILKEKEFNVL